MTETDQLDLGYRNTLQLNTYLILKYLKKKTSMTGSQHVFNVIDNRNLKLSILNSNTNVADNISIGFPVYLI